MVKLFHTSDWHLGRVLFGKSLLEDQEYILQKLIEAIDLAKPQAILISGDLYDRPLPPEAAVQLFDAFLQQTVVERGIQVLLIPGNHDSAERVGFASRLLRRQGLTIFSKPEDALQPVRLAHAGTKVDIFGIPFVEPVQIGRLLGDEKLKTFDDATRALCTEMLKRADPKVPAVLLCHAFAVGGESSDSERDLFVGGSSAVDVSAFQGFAYTALGHLHKPQSAGSDLVRYSGSLLPYSKSESEHVKGVNEIRVSPNGGIEILSHPLVPKRRLRYLEGTLDDLTARAAKDSRLDDYVIAGLTDPGPVVDALARLRALYPNLLHVARALGAFTPSESPSAERLHEKLEVDELDLFGAFVLDSTGTELSAEERDFLTVSIRELDRANGDAP